MAYQALLFCPEEKTARTVTQVLSELEFQVEPCIEPFAAVKKLMSQHFDAIVVDCDNEQNATLLFKSSRNSTSNQTSLAVAIVEGQAGVAKAFRIGANLVLTKPINVEQSKGTLRVARGLLRKGEPVKPGIPGAVPPPSHASAAPTPAKPLTPKPAPRPAPTPSPISHSPAPKPPASLPPRPVAAAKTASAPHSEIESAKTLDSDPTFAAQFRETTSKPAAPKTASIVSTETPESIAAIASASGAASAPARARKPELPVVAQAAPPAAPAKPEKPVEKPVAPVGLEASSSVPSEPAPSFTFGGANVEEPAAGPSKKIFIGIAAVVLIAVGAYAGWPYLQGHKTQPTATVTAPAPVLPKPQPSTPAQVPAPPATYASPATSSETNAVADNTETSPADNDETVVEKASHPTPSAAKSASSAAPKAAPKAAPEKQSASEKSAEAPLLVSGGSAPVHHAPPASDASAPSVIGIAAPSSTGDLSAIATDSGAGAKPVLQAMKVSQGVSQGLIMKRVAPTYPRNALTMGIEGNVDLMATISKDGDIKDIKVLSGDSQLSRAAVQAVKQWKYKPYLLNGEPVEIQTQITVEFKLPH